MLNLIVQQRSAALAGFLDGTGVERFWQSGVHVNWATGETDAPDPDGRDDSTHCSAFVAAISMRLGVYILRPPEHEQQLLANAQARWLERKGRSLGWEPLSGGAAAQERANSGALVVASYRNQPGEPGHIAIVRPSSKNAIKLNDEGPQITQAGTRNYVSTTLKIGFGSRRSKVLYYANANNFIVLTSRSQALSTLSRLGSRLHPALVQHFRTEAFF